MPAINRIQLGATYRERITGFEGVCVGRYEYLTGCTRLTLQSTELLDGKIIEINVDAPMVQFVEMSEDMLKLRAEQLKAITGDPSAAG